MLEDLPGLGEDRGAVVVFQVSEAVVLTGRRAGHVKLHDPVERESVEAAEGCVSLEALVDREMGTVEQHAGVRAVTEAGEEIQQV